MNKVAGVLLGILAVYSLFYLTSTLQGIAQISYTESNNMTSGTNISLDHTIDTNFAVSLYNSSITCAAGNYSYNASHITLKAGQICLANLVYTTGYTYQKSVAIFGIDFAFIALLVFLGIAMLIVMKMTSGGK